METALAIDFGDYAARVHQLTRRSLGACRNEAEIAGGIHLLTIAAERDLVRFGNISEIARVACSPGCSACCMLNVAVLVPEAITIARHLKRTLRPEKLGLLIERLRQLHVKTRWLDDEERMYLREPCAFLDEAGWCRIHTVRPLLCRSITSLDRNTCQEAIVSWPLGETPAILLNIFQKELLDAAYRGLAAGLANLNLDDRPWRITPAVLYFLTEEDAVHRFVAGEPVVRH